jgi:hypothetical protein
MPETRSKLGKPEMQINVWMPKKPQRDAIKSNCPKEQLHFIGGTGAKFGLCQIETFIYVIILITHLDQVVNVTKLFTTVSYAFS